MKLIPLALVAAALPCLAFAQALTVHGNFRHMLHSGETGGVIALDRLTAPSTWGVGATAGLRGEVVIRDGAVLVSPGDDPDGRVTPPDAGEKAVILAFGTVAGWQSFEIAHDMAPDQLTRFIEMQAQGLGLDPEGGFPIRVQGAFPQLVWHVVTGEAPAHGAQDGGHRRPHRTTQTG